MGSSRLENLPEDVKFVRGYFRDPTNIWKCGLDIIIESDSFESLDDISSTKPDKIPSLPFYHHNKITIDKPQEKSNVKKQTEDSWYKKGKIDPNDYAKGWFKHWGKYSYYITVIIKYVTRFKFKNGKEDLLKAKFFIDHLIEYYDIEENKDTCGMDFGFDKMVKTTPNDGED